MITIANIVHEQTRAGCKAKPKSLGIPKVLIAGEILRMTRGRLAALFGAKGIMEIDGLRQQWLDWLDSYPEPLASASQAAWAFQQEQEAGRPEAFEPAKVRL